MPRWVGWMWMATLAVLVGLLIPLLLGSGGAGGPLALVSLLLVIAAVVVTCVVEVANRVGLGGSERVRGTHSLGDAGRLARVRGGQTGGGARTDEPWALLRDADWGELGALATALSPHQVRWLVVTSFTTPWLDQNARSVIALRPRAASLLGRAFPPALAAALAQLHGAVSEFAEYYESNTFPDPVLLGEDWRFFEWDDPRALGHPPATDDLTGGRAERLQGLAAACARGYEQLTESVRMEPRAARWIGSGVR